MAGALQRPPHAARTEVLLQLEKLQKARSWIRAFDALPLRLRLFSQLSLLAVLAGSLFAPPCRAQEPVPPAPPPIQATTELVKVDASVVDKRGNFVGGLSQSSFRVTEGASQQPIEFFAPVEAPAQVLVMIETSPAVYLIHNEHLVAAYALLGGMSADDSVALVTYDRAPRAIVGFTPDKSALLAALGQVQYTIGMDQLNLYDSVSAVLDWLGPSPGKKTLVLLTTGLDSSPATHWEALIRRLRREDVVIFPVALGGSLRGGQGGKLDKKSNRKSDAEESGEPARAANADVFARGDDALRTLATVTGGRAYFPQSGKDFVPVYKEIASALRHQYVLGIAPLHDGQYHALTVGVMDANGRAAKPDEYHVFARAGYLAPGP